MYLRYFDVETSQDTLKSYLNGLQLDLTRTYLGEPKLYIMITSTWYYACLVDDFLKYTWIIPLWYKSDFMKDYFAFEQFVSLQFKKKLKFFALMKEESLSTQSLHLIFIYQVLSIKFHVHIHLNKQVS